MDTGSGERRLNTLRVQVLCAAISGLIARNGLKRVSPEVIARLALEFTDKALPVLRTKK